VELCAVCSLNKELEFGAWIWVSTMNMRFMSTGIEREINMGPGRGL